MAGLRRLRGVVTRPGRTALVVTVLALLAGSTGSPVLAAEPGPAAVPPAVPPAAVHPAAAPAPGAWDVRPEPGGWRITLGAESVPVRAALPALAVDGVVHGPARVAPDRRSVSVVVADPRVRDVRLVWSGDPTPGQERSAQPQPGAEPRPDASAVAPAGPLLATDPGRPGPFRVDVTRYDLGDEAVALPALGGRKVELRGVVTAPVGAPGRRPLVVVLHGQHPTCWSGDRTGPEQFAWPCPPDWAPVPSHEGYQQTARLLASHGQVVVSVSANGINALDDTQDGGMEARAELVLAHLDLWRSSARSSTDTGIARDLARRVDLDRIGLLGHSRGGEGVVRAVALNAARGRPYGVRAVLPLAPTDFTRQTVPGVALAVLQGYCDGDLVNLEGLKYLDDTRYSAADDVPRSTTLVMGANHNFFNVEWTPGESVAPSGDDWQGPVGERACGAAGPARLSPAEQRAVAATHAAAFFGVHLLGRAEWAPLLDGSGARVPSTGRAVLHTSAQAPASARTDIARLADAPLGMTASGPVTARLCRGLEPDPDGLPRGEEPACATGEAPGRFPHLAPAFLARQAPGAGFARVEWRGTGALRVALRGRAADASRESALTFRAAPLAASTDLSVRVTDRAGRRVTVPVSEVSAALRALPGTGDLLPRQVLRQVRVPVDRLAGLDRARLASVELVTDRTRSGAALVTDLAWVRDGTGRPDRRPRPVVSVADIGEVVEGHGGPATVAVRLELSRPAKDGTSVHLETDQHPLDPQPVVQPLRERVVVPAGARSVVVRLPYEADRRDDEDVRPFRLVLSTSRQALVLDPIAVGAVVDDDPSPALTIGDGTASESDEWLELPLRTSRASDRVVFVDGLATGLTATHREDFGFATDPDEGTLVVGEVEPGGRGGVLRVPLVDDRRPEPTETLQVQVQHVVGATIPLPARRTGVIRDDDGR